MLRVIRLAQILRLLTFLRERPIGDIRSPLHELSKSADRILFLVNGKKMNLISEIVNALSLFEEFKDKFWFLVNMGKSKLGRMDFFSMLSCLLSSKFPGAQCPPIWVGRWTLDSSMQEPPFVLPTEMLHAMDSLVRQRIMSDLIRLGERCRRGLFLAHALAEYDLVKRSRFNEDLRKKAESAQPDSFLLGYLIHKAEMHSKLNREKYAPPIQGLSEAIKRFKNEFLRLKPVNSYLRPLEEYLEQLEITSLELFLPFEFPTLSSRVYFWYEDKRSSTEIKRRMLL